MIQNVYKVQYFMRKKRQKIIKINQYFLIKNFKINLLNKSKYKNKKYCKII